MRGTTVKITIESDAGKFTSEIDEGSTWPEVTINFLHLLNTSYIISLREIDYIQDVLDEMTKEKLRKVLEGRGYELD